MAEALRRPSRLQSVDLVRAVSILLVLCTHLFQSASLRPPAHSWERDFWYGLSRNGVYGVFLFFGVSGFLITRLLAENSPGLYRPGFRNFYARRAGRILPLLAATVLAGVVLPLLPLPHARAYAYCFTGDQASHGFFFWASLGTFSFNWYRILHEGAARSLGVHWDVLWSLSIEEQFYLFYPLVLWWAGTERRFLRFLAFVIVLSWAASFTAYLFDPFSYLIFMNSFTAFGSMAVGALLFIVSERYRGFFSRRKGLCAALCLAGGLLVAGVVRGTSWMEPRDWLFTPPLLSLGLFLFLLGALHLDFFESRWLQAFSLPGKLSYGAYLLHPAVFYLLAPFLWGREAAFTYLVFILAVLAVAALSYRFFEVPANRWVRRTLGARGGGWRNRVVR